jgi:hypothetical protein
MSLEEQPFRRFRRPKCLPSSSAVVFWRMLFSLEHNCRDELVEPGDFSRDNRAERHYLEGILADRLNRPSQAIKLLETVLPELTKLNRKRAALALTMPGRQSLQRENRSILECVAL